jgi:hypothetical protein
MCTIPEKTWYKLDQVDHDVVDYSEETKAEVKENILKAWGESGTCGSGRSQNILLLEDGPNSHLLRMLPKSKNKFISPSKKELVLSYHSQ